MEAEFFTPGLRATSWATMLHQGLLLCVLTHCQCFSAALQGTPLSATLSLVMSQCCRKIKDTVHKLASDHKDIHSSVSRVGKAIDRVSMWAALDLGRRGTPMASMEQGSSGSQCEKCEPES